MTTAQNAIMAVPKGARPAASLSVAIGKPPIQSPMQNAKRLTPAPIARYLSFIRPFCRSAGSAASFPPSSPTLRPAPAVLLRPICVLLGFRALSRLLVIHVTTRVGTTPVERVHFKLDVRRRAQKHPFHWLLRNRTFRGKYRASEKVASQRADF